MGAIEPKLNVIDKAQNRSGKFGIKIGIRGVNDVGAFLLLDDFFEIGEGGFGVTGISQRSDFVLSVLALAGNAVGGTGAGG